MKFSCLLVLGLGLFVSGCDSVSQEAVKRSAERYRTVQVGMTEAQVLAAVGEPQRADRSGSFHWETWSTSGDYVELVVHFDEQSVVRTVRQHGERAVPHDPPLKEITNDNKDVVPPYSQGWGHAIWDRDDPR